MRRHGSIDAGGRTRRGLRRFRAIRAQGTGHRTRGRSRAAQAVRQLPPASAGFSRRRRGCPHRRTISGVRGEGPMVATLGQVRAGRQTQGAGQRAVRGVRGGVRRDVRRPDRRPPVPAADEILIPPPRVRPVPALVLPLTVAVARRGFKAFGRRRRRRGGAPRLAVRPAQTPATHRGPPRRPRGAVPVRDPDVDAGGVDAGGVFRVQARVFTRGRRHSERGDRRVGVRRRGVRRRREGRGRSRTPGTRRRRAAEALARVPGRADAHPG
mmetsp:Transcript_2213/g.9394  ORF Transcript_2213/g.9394 Transcript_2213/m.9394 type:complete len:268 (+) Transcript_2213:585-1388(+)